MLVVVINWCLGFLCRHVVAVAWFCQGCEDVSKMTCNVWIEWHGTLSSTVPCHIIPFGYKWAWAEVCCAVPASVCVRRYNSMKRRLSRDMQLCCVYLTVDRDDVSLRLFCVISEISNVLCVMVGWLHVGWFYTEACVWSDFHVNVTLAKIHFQNELNAQWQVLDQI